MSDVRHDVSIFLEAANSIKFSSDLSCFRSNLSQKKMVKLPHLTGFGLWKVPSETAAQTVYDALKLGYRTLDGASDYGNEKEGGEGLARAIEEGLVTREEVFITSKLWNTNHSKAAAAEAVRNQLKNWGISYFDLYLIHFPISLEHVPVTVRSNPEWWDGTPGSSQRSH